MKLDLLHSLIFLSLVIGMGIAEGNSLVKPPITKSLKR